MLVYYVTAHGYGHASRSCDVVRAARTRHPDMPVTIVSGLTASFFGSRLGLGIPVRRAALDLGMVQVDSVRTDVVATLAELQGLHAQRDRLIAEETQFLSAVDARLVVVDIPAMPLAAAARLGIPGVAIGNFGWDWIYEEYLDSDPGWAPIVASIRHDYGLAAGVLRLPFSEPMSAFRERLDVPLVAAPGLNRRGELARITGADPDRPWILLSFTTLEWDRRAIDRLCSGNQYCFCTVLPLAWNHPGMVAVNRNQIPFSDVLASVDAVVSKPGFGIVSECIVNQKPLLYVDRSHFREYPCLVEGIHRYLQHEHIPAAVFYQGGVAPYLERLFGAPPPQMTLHADQGAAAADAMAAYWHGG